MQLTKKDIKEKKKVGRLGHSPVIELTTKGGLSLIVAMRGGRVETLGAGPHPAVARHIAKRREEAIEFTDLSKSDPVEPWMVEDMLPEWEQKTDHYNERLQLLQDE